MDKKDAGDMTPAERAAYERGKKEEREACAKAVEALPRGTWGDESGERCPWPIAARAIRERQG